MPTMNESSYFLPVNKVEAERLMMQHTVLIDALGGRLVCAPIDLSKPGLKILDSGTADDTSFYIHNISKPWPETELGTFDLVHQRLTLPGGAPTPLATIVRQLFDLVKPGGWIQLVEAEQTGPDAGSVFHEFLGLVRALFDATGAGWHYADNLKQWLEDAGAVDVHDMTVNMGFGKKNENPDLAAGSARCTAQAMEGLVMHAKSMDAT
ncbi:unnamed protein product [Periconia digitata]|uniref:Methyltransferase n=1 Tax=Periconia digitata TaxID=1303443 RepID=A0A9W4UFM4_9PLEO|nr:unnamed protein product [Periconia digitata]